MSKFQKALAALFALALSVAPPAIAAQNSTVMPTSGPLSPAAVMNLVSAGFLSVMTNNSGPTPPANSTGNAAATYQFWLDTSTTIKVLRIYDGAQWVALGTLDTAAHAFSIPISQIPTTDSGANHTFTDSEKNTFIVFTNSGAVTLNLPQAGPATLAAGWFVDIRYTGSATATLTPTVSTIDGLASLPLTPGKSCRIFSDGTNYQTTCNLGTPSTATLGGVFSSAAVTNQFLTGIGTNGSVTRAQPAAADLSNGTTGSGAVVLANTPTLITPNIGVATATSINGNVWTAGTGTLTLGAGKTLTVNNSLTFTGTDGTSFATPGASDTLVGLAAAQTLTNKTLTAPTINGGTHTAITSFGVRSTGAAFDLKLANTEVLTADRTLTVILNDASRSMNLGGNFATAGPLSFAGAFSVTFTATNSTTVTLPTTGTLATLAGAETLSNKTIDTASSNVLKINGNTLAASAGTATVTLPNATDTLVGRATTDTLTNKTINGSSNTLTVLAGSQLSGQTPIANGGTGASTAPLARVALNTESVTTFTNTSVSATATDRTIASTATNFTAARTVTLAAVSAYNPGQIVVVVDSGGAINGANTLTVAANAGDTINGVSSVTISTQYGGGVFYPIGSNRWGYIASAGGGGGGVSSVGSGNCLSGGPITSSGTLNLADDCRQSILLDRGYLAKVMQPITSSSYRKVVNAMADGFKASDGINATLSNNYTLDTTGGKVSPTAAAGTYTQSGVQSGTTVMGAAAPSYTYVNRNTTITNSTTICYIGLSLASAETVTLKIIRRISSTVNDIVFSQSFNHPGGGYANMTMSSCYAVPASGTFYPAVWYPNSAARNSVPSVARSYYNGDPAVQNGLSGWTDDTSGGPALQWAPAGAPDPMTLTTTSQASDSAVSYGRGLQEFDNVGSPTLNTDLTNEITCDVQTATVTISVASPGVVTHTSHGLLANAPVALFTTGALPTGLTAGRTYYVKTVLTSNTYTLSATPGGAAINTTGTQSGVHTADYSNWVAATLTQATAYSQSGRRVAESADQACGASGSLWALRVRTFNAKNVPIYVNSAVFH